MKIETDRYLYPNVPGSHGIDFDKLFRKAGRDFVGYFKSESGIRLQYIITSGYIQVLDSPEFELMAGLNPKGMIEFDLMTRVREKVSNRLLKLHPDFFAKAFVGVAIDYFGRFHEIAGCKGKWREDSDNGRAFLQAYDKAKDNRVEAAQTTWSAQTFSSYGFSRISHDDITFQHAPDGEREIIALFRPE